MQNKNYSDFEKDVIIVLLDIRKNQRKTVNILAFFTVIIIIGILATIISLVGKS